MDRLKRTAGAPGFVVGPSIRRCEQPAAHRHGLRAASAVIASRDEVPAAAHCCSRSERVSTVRSSRRELDQVRFETFARLAAIAEAHDDDTGEHTRRVGALSVRLAARLGLPAAEVDLIGLAAPLHDIGKITIPPSVLGKPGRLTREEFEQLKTHTTVGAQLLPRRDSPLLELARQIALSHHERWDGSGYPAGLSGTDIPIAGRIVAVADVFDALTHARPYKAAWSREEAIAQMTSPVRPYLDPVILEAFLSLS